MNKEKLEKYAEEYAKNLLFVFETDIVQRIVRERVRLALIDVLEPKEKRIAELEETLGKCAKMPVLYCLGAKETITKAKEIIKDLLSLCEGETDSKLVFTRAEQFLKDIEVEK